MKATAADYSRYFWQGNKVRLRPLRIEDAEHSFITSLDSASRRMLQLGIELPTSVEILKSSLEKYAGCRDADGVIMRKTPFASCSDMDSGSGVTRSATPPVSM